MGWTGMDSRNWHNYILLNSYDCTAIATLRIAFVSYRTTYTCPSIITIIIQMSDMFPHPTALLGVGPIKFRTQF